ncbi:MAG: DUF2075 domain-containing protein [Phycisphaerae bacterium]|nr:DUF2075 domain-containing protein [Phycisphaerae bacterium]
MKREYYSDSIEEFLKTSSETILGKLAQSNSFSLEQSQRDAWLIEIEILRKTLSPYSGTIYFEYTIPRMGQRIDVILLIGPVLFVLEFKIGEKDFRSSAKDQVWDYALDLKNFHESSHQQLVAPILIATEASDLGALNITAPRNDQLFDPILTNAERLGDVLKAVLGVTSGHTIDRLSWESGRYSPTPTIVEAATALYSGHSVGEISRSDAGAVNLHQTSDAISTIIRSSKEQSRKSICFVTGVPGAGKTLVGLNTAITHIDKTSELYSVYLSGNGPLVKILCEALTRDKVQQEKSCGHKIKKGEVYREVKMFIQNVHHFRDECLTDDRKPPIEHVVLFDEAQRAWNLEQTAKFMKNKKHRPGFSLSEPEFLISCLDRHRDWAVIVCLVGGGQEINTGEAGIGEWITALNRSYPEWDVYVSRHLTDSEYAAGVALELLKSRKIVVFQDELHLAVSMRSFRAENVSLLVKQLLDRDISNARRTLDSIKQYPIVITRSVNKAKRWIKDKARGSERYGIIVSSNAQRLKPHAIDVKTPMNPVHWFLDGKEDIRSSYYLEDVATEFSVQGLELDWACVAWDGDFRYSRDAWEHWSFCGDRWNRIHKAERRQYQKNAYRVLLTRARQGMVIVVPEGDPEDPTRSAGYYDPTYGYLKSIGFGEI